MDDDIEIEIEESGQEFAAAPGMNCFLKFLKLQVSTSDLDSFLNPGGLVVV